MQDFDGNTKAFANFRVLNGNADSAEREQLFRHLAQLFSFVSDRCDDVQVQEYDHVLCQLAEMVDAEARAHVSKLLAPLDRAPGGMVARLARDEISVAQPLLQFSKVLCDDDLIEITANATEEHRVAIAARCDLGARVGEALVEHGGRPSVMRLVQNGTARLECTTLEALVLKAANDDGLANNLRGREDIDWDRVACELNSASKAVMRKLSLTSDRMSKEVMRQASAVVYQRLRSRAGFNAQDWKIAWNQVKAVNDRGELTEVTLQRFARFGYSHQTACTLTMLLNIPTEVMLKWLAGQDYVAVTVALRALMLDPMTAQNTFRVLPWRDAPTRSEINNMLERYQTLGKEEASEIFAMWQSHSFRNRTSGAEDAA